MTNTNKMIEESGLSGAIDKANSEGEYRLAAALVGIATKQRYPGAKNPRSAALDLACLNKNFPLVKYLLENTDADPNEMSTLSTMVQLGNLELVKLLILKSSIDEVNFAIRCAVHSQYIDILRFLIPYSNLAVKNNPSDAIIRAASKGSREMVKELIPYSNLDIIADLCLNAFGYCPEKLAGYYPS